MGGVLTVTTTSKTIRTSSRRAWSAAALLMAVLFMVPVSAWASWWNDEWSNRKQLTVDAGPAGAALPGNVARMPVLIRLHDGNFRFSDAKPDGTDLRFVADDDKTPLRYQIEKYDSTFDVAFVWVDLPEVKAGAAVNIWMYWGNKNAADGQDKSTFDSDSVLVYHFGETSRPPQDASSYGNHALTQARNDDATLIGGGVRFDGNSAIQLPVSPSLATADGGQFTWSAWIKADNSKPDGVLYARTDGGAKQFVIGLAQGSPFVAVATASSGSLRSGQVPPIADGQWHHVAVTAADRVILYVDGQAKSILAVAMPGMSGTASLGAAYATGAPGSVEPNSGFLGEMDEVEIAKTARTPAWVAAAALSQGAEQKLVKYSQDEQAPSWSSGYVGVILGSVTLDGWVVIALLMVMAVISWLVMITKSRYVGSAAKSNEAFLALFNGGPQQRGFLAELALERIPASSLPGGPVSESQRRLATNSALFHLYSAGLREVTQRFPNGGRQGSGLSSHAVEAIRATLDSQAVREIQSLNDRMVLLTIAISGGPFIGLLGTVLGVMITFASIAASGDVNINAIAPGIAAALAATVAGLIVAIPALFGYNYLISRIKDLTASQQVFLDSLVTRMAEAGGLPDFTPSMVAE